MHCYKNKCRADKHYTCTPYGFWFANTCQVMHADVHADVHLLYLMMQRWCSSLAVICCNMQMWHSCYGKQCDWVLWEKCTHSVNDSVRQC